MLLSYQWLTELVELPEGMKQKDVAECLTLAGLEVEGVHGDVLELKITPNRPDALSHIGVARELSAILQTRMRVSKPNVKELSGPIHDVAQVQIAERALCPRYACRVVEGVEIKESPPWLSDRLSACGIRPINNVVDVTNWVLLERGHPLHAFDFDRLNKQRGRATLFVRLAQKGEKLKTLDGKDRVLSETDLVIADAERTLALAGVMGGQDTEVTQQSTNVLLESAYFEPSQVRQSARRHGLSTEGSYRFERGADPNGVLLALDRAAQMIVEVAGGRVRREAIDVYPRPIEPVEISVRRQRMLEISGLSEEYLKDTAIRERFLKLGIETVGRLGGDAMSFRVPTFRPDITREIDLIEEAMRLIGYDKVPNRLVFTKSALPSLSGSLERVVDQARDALTAAGFSEAINFSFGSPSRYARFESKHPFIKVTNPLGEELSLMRQSLLPGLSENLEFNLRQGTKQVSLFETGHVFLGLNSKGKIPNTTSLQGKANQDTWANEHLYLAALTFGNVDFFDLKGVVEELFTSWRIEIEFRRPEKPVGYLHPGESAELVAGKQVLGVMGRLHPDIHEAAYVFELDLGLIEPLSLEYALMKAIPKFPSIRRDIALVLGDEISAGQVIAQVKKNFIFPEFIEDVRIFDVYKGDKIAVGKKSMAVSLQLRAMDHTLTDEEIADGMKKLIHSLEKEFTAQIR